MNKIKIIKDKNLLEGTCYIEILPGSYKNKCWNNSSLFFEEEVFGYIEKIIEKHVANYDHYAFTEIDKERWLKIANDLDDLCNILSLITSMSELKNYIGFLFNGSDKEFEENFQENKIALSELSLDFSLWIKYNIKEQGVITILGM